jgi:uncharacterized protein YndB with AHSA1/START domain
MSKTDLIIERIFDTSIENVWKSLTTKDLLKQWCFDLEEFIAEEGFKFEFRRGPSPEKQYLHLCEITKIIHHKFLTYSWKYAGYSGVSFVTFELFELGDKTLLKLTHSGIESFANEHPDFVIDNFEKGWNEILNTLICKVMEKENFKYEFEVNATPIKIFDSITNKIPLWWTELFEGKSNILDESFTVRFGPSVFKTMRVKELILNKEIVWLVVDTLIDIPELTNKKEWLNTKIVWNIKEDKNGSKICLTHFGLNPNIECYGICSTGWKQFCTSLKTYLENGEGMPYKQ